MIRRIFFGLVIGLWTFCAEAVRTEDESLLTSDTSSTHSRTESPSKESSGARKRVKLTLQGGEDPHLFANPHDPFIAILPQRGSINVRPNLHEDTGIFEETLTGNLYIPLASLSHIHWIDIPLKASDCQMAALGFSPSLQTCILEEMGLTLPEILIFEQGLRNKLSLRELRIIQRKVPLLITDFSIIARTALLSPWLQHIQVHSPTFDDEALEVTLPTLTHCNIKTFEMGYGISASGLRRALRFLTEQRNLSPEEVSLWLSGKFDFSDFTDVHSVFTRFPHLRLSLTFMPGSLLNSDLFAGPAKTYERVQLDRLGEMYSSRLELSAL